MQIFRKPRLTTVITFAALAVAGCASSSGKRELSATGSEEVSFEELRAAPGSLERRGCCAKNGGVCGCSTGKAQCCDGSLSPRCACD